MLLSALQHRRVVKEDLKEGSSVVSVCFHCSFKAERKTCYAYSQLVMDARTAS